MQMAVTRTKLCYFVTGSQTVGGGGVKAHVIEVAFDETWWAAAFPTLERVYFTLLAPALLSRNAAHVAKVNTMLAHEAAEVAAPPAVATARAKRRRVENRVRTQCKRTDGPRHSGTEAERRPIVPGMIVFL